MTKILCKAITKKGTHCQNTPKSDSDFCKIHQPSVPVQPDPEPEEPMYVEHSELEMGELTIYFPNEIIREILKYLNIFDLTNFSMTNRSCHRFVKVYHMIPKNEKKKYQKFIEYFKDKQSLVNVEKAKEYHIPVCDGQQLVIYPSRFIGMKKIELLVRRGVDVKFKEIHNDIVWVYNKNELPSIEKDFVHLNKAMKHLLDSKMIKWNIRELYLHVDEIVRYLEDYRKKHPERIVRTPQ